MPPPPSTEITQAPPPEVAAARDALSGPQKAAVLLVTLGPERAAEIFRYLPDDDVESLSMQMAQTYEVGAVDSEAVLGELVDTLTARGVVAEGGVPFAREVLEQALGPERAAEILGRLSAAIERRPFEFLRRTPPEQIVTLLRHEAPQTVALVVANLHTTLAGQVLALLPPETQADVGRRVAATREVSPVVVQDVEHVLRQRLSSVVTHDYSTAGGVKALADILNTADRATERNVLDQLGESDPDLADEVRRLLFTFEDLVKLDDRAMQLVLREVESGDLALALRGVSPEVRDKVFANMSSRGVELLEEEMEFQPPQLRSVVEQAQSGVVAVVRRLEERGEVVLGRGGGGDDVVV